MAVKIDLTKAYDKVEWKVLGHIMKNFEFHEHSVTMVLECVSSSQFSVLLNGSPFGYFKSERRIRQGDPMSPTIFSDLLSQILAKALETVESWVSKCQGTTLVFPISCMLTDLASYYKENQSEAEAT